jgi:hypothetical protein
MRIIYWDKPVGFRWPLDLWTNGSAPFYDEPKVGTE